MKLIIRELHDLIGEGGGGDYHRCFGKVRSECYLRVCEEEVILESTYAYIVGKDKMSSMQVRL